jgi:hypothetical protein
MTAALLLLTGCGGGIHWRFVALDDALATARAQNKLAFVYFRTFWSVPCTEFENQVLLRDPVLAETRDMVCVPLNYDLDRPIAERWGLREVPSFAIVAPDQTVLASGAGRISETALLSSFRSAKSRFAAMSRTAAAAK